MVKETARQEEFLLTIIIHFEHYYKIKMASAVRSRIRRNSSLQAVWDTSIARTTYGFYVTSSRMLFLVEGNKI